MKKTLSVLLAALIITASAAGYAMTENEVIDHFEAVTSGKETAFTDISAYPWAVTPIETLAKKGIVSGVGGGLFLPGNTVSRFEFFKMITGVCGIVNPNATADYRDVPSDHWAYTYVASAHEIGLMDIYSSVILNGQAPITREEMAYIGANALIKNGCLEALSSAPPRFTDADYMSGFAPRAVATLSELGVINGRGDGTFCPKDYATRAECAKIIYNILDVIENNF